MSSICVSIVLYKNKLNEIDKLLNILLKSSIVDRVCLVDNSPTNYLMQVLKVYDDRVIYIQAPFNLGYGAAHNIAIRKSIEDNITYHIVMNPDIYFENDVLEKLVKYMEKNMEVGLVMPKVIYPDGEIQYLCKLIPTPIDLFGRRFLPKYFTRKRNEKFELRFTGYDKMIEVPYLSGCFMFLRVSVVKEVGLFDERFFMYMEDVDFSRRINEKYRTVYFPEVFIVHAHAKESYRNFKMLKMHILSAIKYFNKWGWFNDEKRKMQNNKILNNLGNK